MGVAERRGCGTMVGRSGETVGYGVDIRRGGEGDTRSGELVRR
jgi:hypothetical protein